jgi:hypothetical protein
MVELPVEKVKEREKRLPRGIYLSFVVVFKIDAQEEIADYLKVYLLNEQPVDVRFTYDLKLENNSEFRHSGQLHAFGNVYLHNIPFGQMNSQPRFHWLLNDATAKMEPAEGVLRIKPQKLFEHINNALQNSEPSFSYKLIDDFLPAQPKQEAEPFAAPISLPTGRPVLALEPARHEVDLHIEQLVSDWKKLSTAEIIKKQLDVFERYLHLAIVHHLGRMIVIHGLGTGKLREEVHGILRKTPEVGRFKNEWSGKYGFGATEIVFRY